MKKKEKILILALVIITIIVVIIYIARKNGNKTEVDNNANLDQPKEEFVQVLEDGTKLNISTKLNETKKVGSFEIGNIQLTEKNGQSLLLADVVNKSSSATKVTIVDITLLNKEGNEIVTLGGIIGALQPEETVQLNISTTLDYANAYDFTVKIN